MSRSSEVRTVKAELNAGGHEMGNVVNVSPFGQTDPTAKVAYTVHTTCRKCGLGLYIEKAGDKINTWGDAKACNKCKA